MQNEELSRAVVDAIIDNLQTHDIQIFHMKEYQCAGCEGTVSHSGGLCEDCSKPDWHHRCEICGEVPILPATGLCGVCNFGTVDAVGGNW